MKPVHHAAATGFGTAAIAYARGRPDYPEALDRWLREAVGLDAGRTVVDLGAGTGKFLPRLLATGARVIAVEPVGAMRAELAAEFPDVEAIDGTAESLPFGDASIDAVVCAQAFHWFATAAAVAEIARVVRPYEGDTPRFHRGDWRRVFPAEGFDALEETHFPHVHAGSPQQVIVDRFLSVSFIAALPGTERTIVEDRLRTLIRDEPLLAGRPTIEMPYDTVAFVARRRRER